MPLLLVENGAQKGQRFAIGAPGPFCIGRDPAAEVRLPDPMVSRRHSAIEVRGAAYVLRDLGSANGTLLNGERVEERELQLGDRILAGDTLLSFLADGAVDPLVGKTLKGYEILKRLGRGGMGTVYQARQTSLERFVALKLLAPELVKDPAFVARFLDEARAAARLNHPNIVMVYDIDETMVQDLRAVYYSMEFMAGGSVEDLLRREGRFDPERALGIALQTARGLLYAEGMGLVHRDIKPGNLMVHESGAIKIGDLGIAARATAGGMASQRGGVSGSPHFISPEQARGQDIDSRADIYSLGVSLYQMLAGKPPFSGTEVRELILKHLREPPEDLAALRPDLHPAIPPLVARMLEKSRDRRHPNARALIAALEGALAELRAPAPAPTAAASPLRRRLGALVLGLVVIGGIAGGAAFAHRGWRNYRDRRAQVERMHRDRLEAARAALEAREPDEAEEELRAVAAAAGLPRDFPALAEEARVFGVRLEALRAELAGARRNEAAALALAAVRSALPDLASLRSVKELEALLPPLLAVERDHAGTPAALEAAEESARVRAAIRHLAARIERGESALRSLLITAGTFLDSQPPRYREALQKLREPPEEVRGTPAQKELERRLAEVARAMLEDSQRWAREAEAAAAAGNAGEARRTLERLRDRVEGEALKAVERALRRIGEGGR